MVEFSTKGFMSNVGRSRGKFSRWKEAGSTVGFIHPGLRIHGRRAHGIIPVVLVKDGKEEPANKRFNCAVQPSKEDERITREQEAACPLCSLVKFAEKKLADGVDASEVALHSGSSEKVSFTWAMLANRMQGKQWRQNLGYARNEYVFAWIPAKKEERGDNPVEIMTEGEGVGSAIKAVISSRIQDFGEEEGDLYRRPFPIKLIHNKKEERPAYKYTAMPVDKELAPIDAEIEEIMGATQQDLGVDLVAMCEAGHVGDMMGALRSSWNSRAVPFEEFEEFFGQVAPKNQPEAGHQDQPQQTGQPEGKPEGGFCPACGKPAGGGKFCRECGEPLGSKQASQPAEQPKEEPAGEGQVKCCNPKCGKMITPTQFGKRCPECGTQQDVPFK